MLGRSVRVICLAELGLFSGVLHRAWVACWAVYLTDLELIVGKVLMLMSF